MTREELKQVAWIGDDWVQGPIRAVVVSFHGLGTTALRTGPSTEELTWSQQGALCVFPCYGPWSWMNRHARAYVHDIIESVYSVYHLPANTPLIANGGSMGGCSSLLFTRYSQRPVAACAANCPVCDIKFHFSERPDLPTSMRYAFHDYGTTWEQIFIEQSPLCQVEAFPNIPYFIIHGGQDKAVSKENHSDKIVPVMRKRGLNIEYVEVPNMGHCGPLPVEVLTQYIHFVASHFGPARK